MKHLAVILLFLALGVQFLGSFGAFVLPSMASADGVAVYPSTAKVAVEFLLKSSAYLFALALLRFAPDKLPSTPLALASLATVLYPLGLLGVCQFLDADQVRWLRENYWPVKPVVDWLVLVGVFLAARFLLSRSDASD